MTMPHPYAGHEVFEPEPVPVPSADNSAVRQLEAENQRLRDVIKHQDAALRCAAKVLRPYWARS